MVDGRVGGGGEGEGEGEGEPAGRGEGQSVVDAQGLETHLLCRGTKLKLYVHWVTSGAYEPHWLMGSW